MKLTVLIPAYNEEKTINEILRRVNAVRLDDVSMEIIVVDDGSTDGTAQRVADFIANTPNPTVITLLQKPNGGKGSAIRYALPKATGDYVIIQDADLEYDPQDFNTLMRVALENKVPVVYGSRIMNPENGISYFSFYWGGRFLSWLTSVLYGVRITDEATCYKLVRKDLLDGLKLESRGFDFCPEVTGKLLRQGIPIIEVPIHYQPRSKEEGKKIRWTDGLQAIWILIKLRFRGKKAYPLITSSCM